MNLHSPRPARALLGLALGFTMALHPESAAASGVTAGTLIQNTASASYNSGGSNGTAVSNTVAVRVDELLDVAVAALNPAPVALGPGNAVIAWMVTNTGNGSEAFMIVVDPGVAGNGFDAVVIEVATDSNGNGTYEPGSDALLPPGSATPAIAADGALTLFAVVALPPGASDGQASEVRLTATAVTGTGAAGTVFSGQGMGGGDAVAGVSTASDNALEALVATLSGLTLTKTATIADPFGGTQPVPGAVITYKLSAAFSGSGQADTVQVSDAIPAGTTYQSGTLSLDAAPLSDAADTDAGTASAALIQVDLGTISASTTRTIRFNVRIN